MVVGYTVELKLMMKFVFGSLKHEWKWEGRYIIVG